MRLKYLFVIIVILLFQGCVSVPDLGIYNQGDTDENELAMVTFDTSLQLRFINGERFTIGRYTHIETGFIFRMPAGEYEFLLDWVTGLNQWSNIEININIEPGKKYRMRHRVDGLILMIYLVDEHNNVIQSVTREYSGIKYI